MNKAMRMARLTASSQLKYRVNNVGVSYERGEKGNAREPPKQLDYSEFTNWVFQMAGFGMGKKENIYLVKIDRGYKI